MIYVNGQCRGDSCREGDFRFGKGGGDGESATFVVTWDPGVLIGGEGKGGWEVRSSRGQSLLATSNNASVPQTAEVEGSRKWDWVWEMATSGKEG